MKIQGPSADWDKRLIDLFVAGLNRKAGTSYQSPRYPDREDRRTKAVDAMYFDPANGSLAIEHTCLEPFIGATAYERGPLKTVWEPLKQAPLPEYHISLRVPLKGVVRGSNWGEAASLVNDWFLREKDNFPLGETSFEIPGIQPPLRVKVFTQYIKGYPGSVSIGTYDRAFQDRKQSILPRLKKSLTEKLPKLVRTEADRRVLLIELLDRSLGNLWDLAKITNELKTFFPYLSAVELWGTDDSRSGIAGTPTFCHLQGGFIVRAFLARPIVSLIPPSH